MLRIIGWLLIAFGGLLGLGALVVAVVYWLVEGELDREEVGRALLGTILVVIMLLVGIMALGSGWVILLGITG